MTRTHRETTLSFSGQVWGGSLGQGKSLQVECLALPYRWGTWAQRGGLGPAPLNTARQCLLPSRNAVAPPQVGCGV